MESPRQNYSGRFLKSLIMVDQTYLEIKFCKVTCKCECIQQIATYRFQISAVIGFLPYKIYSNTYTSSKGDYSEKIKQVRFLEYLSKSINILISHTVSSFKLLWITLSVALSFLVSSPVCFSWLWQNHLIIRTNNAFNLLICDLETPKSSAPSLVGFTEWLPCL